MISIYMVHLMLTLHSAAVARRWTVLGMINYFLDC